MIKKTLYGIDAREKIFDGVKKITDAVRVTLGALGRNVILSQSAIIDYDVRNLPIRITKDGFNVARSFDLDDKFEKVGVLMIQECTEKSVSQCGDGTTTTAILAAAILEAGINLVNDGKNPVELKREIDKSVEKIVAELKAIAVPIKGDIEKIRQIATVSANNDAEIGNMIADAFQKIGEEGVIDIEPSKGVTTEIKISDGYKWDSGWVSPLFINSKEKGICEFIDPLILMYEKRITHHTQVQRALEMAMERNKPILIICEDIDEEGLSFLAMNTIQGRIRCCAVKSPFGMTRREEMEDIAMLTGGTYISDSKGVGIKDIDFENFGSAKKIIVSKEETIIIGGNANEDDLNELLNELRMNLTQAKNEDEKYPIEKRIARLTGGVAVIQVGAATETEMKEKLDRFDDSVRATKSAIEEGFVAGGGTAFLKIFTNSFLDEVLKEPFKQICKNAGVESEGKIDEIIKEGGDYGYNAKTDTMENLVESGIIDPVKVLRCALQNAASSAGIILTAECMIVDTM